MTTILPDRVSVLGAGSWGTALAILIAHNIKHVTLWGRNQAHLDNIGEKRENKRYLPGIILPENMAITSNFNDAIQGASKFLIVVPSQAFRQTLSDLKQALLDQDQDPSQITIIWGTKGFDANSGKLLSQVTEEVFGSIECGVISGPSFATETASGFPTALTLASQTIRHAEVLSRWFRTESTRVYFSDDPVGVQLGGAIKNIMAIAAGISDGLGFGANARAGLITRGLSEMSRLGVALGGKAETFMGLTGVGDLILTCTDDQSRNRRFGLGLGQGKSTTEIVSEIGQEIEGINTVKELFGISQNLGVDMPITEQVYNIIHQQAEPSDAVKNLLTRHPKAEAF